MYSTNFQGGALYEGSKGEGRAAFFTKYPNLDVRGQAASKFALNFAVGYRKPINKEEVDKYSGIITYEGYETRVKPSNAKNIDVSHEWIDFIVDTAKYHKFLDKGTGGTLVKNEGQYSLNFYLDVMTDPDTPYNYRGTPGYFVSHTLAISVKDRLSSLAVKPGGILVKYQAANSLVNAVAGNERDLNLQTPNMSAGGGIANTENDRTTIMDHAGAPHGGIMLGLGVDEYTSVYHALIAQYLVNLAKFNEDGYNLIRVAGSATNAALANAVAANVDDQVKYVWKLLKDSAILGTIRNNILNIDQTLNYNRADMRTNRGLLLAIYDAVGVTTQNITNGSDDLTYDRPRLDSSLGAAWTDATVKQPLECNVAGEGYLNVAGHLPRENVKLLPISTRHLIHTLAELNGKDKAKMDEKYLEKLKGAIEIQLEKDVKAYIKRVLQDETAILGTITAAFPGAPANAAEVFTDKAGAAGAAARTTMKSIFEGAQQIANDATNVYYKATANPTDVGKNIRYLAFAAIREQAKLKNYFKTGTDEYKETINGLATIIRQQHENFVKTELQGIFTTLNNNHTFYKEVLQKWSEIKAAKNDGLYREFMEIRDENNIRVEWETAAQIPSNLINKYRVDMRKTGTGTDTKFAKALPYYNENHFGDIWWRPNSSDGIDIQKIKDYVEKGGKYDWGHDERLFEKIYTTVFNNRDPDENAIITVKSGRGPTMRFTNKPRVIDNKEYFHWRFEKLIKKMLAAAKSSRLDSDVSMEEITNIYIKRDLWKRDANNNNKLYLETNGQSGGAKLYLGDDVDEIDKVLDNSADTCMTTRYNGENCADYLQNCILGNSGKENLKECVTFLRDKENFRDILKGDLINKLHPDMAIQTLKTLGFKAKLVADDPFALDKKIKKVQSVQEWINTGLKNSTLSRAEEDEIKSNDVLLTYLRYLTEFVNANPELLNKDYTGPTVEKEGVTILPDYSKNLGMRLRSDTDSQIGLIRTGSMLQLGNKLRSMQRGNIDFNRLGTPLSVRGAFPVSIPITLSGGGKVKVMYAKRQHGGDDLKYWSAAHGHLLLEDMFKELIALLATHNKKLSPDTKNKIENNLKQFGELEGKILNSLEYIRITTDILDGLKGVEVTDNLFNESHLRRFVAKYKHFVDKYENAEITMLSIYKTLAEIESGDGDGDDDQSNTVELNRPER